MEFTTVVITLILLMLFIIPFYFAARKRGKASILLLKKFELLERNKNLHFSEQEVWGNHAIGIDRDSKFVLYAKGKELDENVEIIDLQKVKRCEVFKIARESQTTSVIDQIALRIIYKDTAYSHLQLEFYNVSGSLQVNNELELAEKWAKVINKNLN
jgi:hypothetical protein